MTDHPTAPGGDVPTDRDDPAAGAAPRAPEAPDPAVTPSDLADEPLFPDGRDETSAGATDTSDDTASGDDADSDDHEDVGTADDSGDGAPDWESVAAEDPRTRGELLAALAAADGARDDYLDALQRKQAEFENFRRRTQQAARQERVAGHADVAGRVLEVLDDFDRTLASIATTADEGVVKGVSLVRDKLVTALREVGLERVDDAGATFDPNRHEAVQQVPREDGVIDAEPVVAEVLRPGYVMEGRVLRAAMVAVAQ